MGARKINNCFFVKSCDILTDFVLCDTINFALLRVFKMCKRLHIEAIFLNGKEDLIKYFNGE